MRRRGHDRDAAGLRSRAAGEGGAYVFTFAAVVFLLARFFFLAFPFPFEKHVPRTCS